METDADDPTKPNSFYFRLFAGRRQTSLHLYLFLSEFLSSLYSLCLCLIQVQVNWSSLIYVCLFGSIFSMFFLNFFFPASTVDALLDCCMDCVLFVIVRSLMVIAGASVCFYRIKLFCLCCLLFLLLCYAIVSYSFLSNKNVVCEPLR